VPGGKRLVAIVVLTLGAGAVMATAGYLFRTRGWATAGPTTIPAGVLISTAFAIAAGIAKATGPDQPATRVPWHRHARRMALMLVVPIGGDGAPVLAQIASGVLALLSGAILVFGGYAGAAWSWWLLPPLVLASGLTISGAFAATVVPVMRRASGSGS
jgi:hypothetical protein